VKSVPLIQTWSVSFSSSMSIAENIAQLRERVASVAHRAGHRSEDVSLMAVTKGLLPAIIREAYDAGIRVFGENRVQEFSAKDGVLAELKEAEWHMIGHLQSNKAVRAVELFNSIDSVDSVRLAQKLTTAASNLKRRLPVLVEINIGGEQAKTGVAPDSAELQDLLRVAPELASLDLHGLMAVPPYSDDPKHSRSYFRKMRRLFEEIAARNLPGVQMEILSMGMSHDFEIAIEEGSTCVRIGTAIFGERKPERSKA